MTTPKPHPDDIRKDWTMIDGVPHAEVKVKAGLTEAQCEQVRQIVRSEMRKWGFIQQDGCE